MARQQTFLQAQWSDQFKKSYAALQQAEKKGADKVMLALIKREPTPGMRAKPIEPEKYYTEARVNDGDRMIYREADGAILFVDVVAHDDIAKCSKRRA